MCGIAGIWNQRDEATVLRMTQRMKHRGPDDHGVQAFQAGAASVTLGHRRLSIIDLSADGHQPMTNEDGTVWITFNGEIYNFPELRKILQDKGHVFRSRSDTEVIVHGYEEWGRELLPKLNGIFAFGIWDSRKQTLLLARDRFGVKPLYLAKVGDRTCFASEIKCLLEVPGLNRELDREAVLAMARYRYCPEPLTLFKHIRKLPPAGWLEISLTGETSGIYFSTDWKEPAAANEAQAASELREVLQKAATRQLIADVPVGFFLSGGLDSSALVALTRDALAGQRSKSFTIGFRAEDQKSEGQVDDLIYARRVAQSFGLDHQEIILEPKIVDLLSEVIWHLDEPIADPAAITSHLICGAAASQGIKVLLSGQGGDEVFAGYPWHLGASLARKYRCLPSPVRKLGGMFASKIGGLGGKLAGPARRIRKFTASASLPFEDSLLGFLSYADDQALRSLFGSQFNEISASGWPDKLHRQLLHEAKDLHWINQMLHLDMGTFLPSLNLAYTDKTSMAHSVEVRVPLIDNEVVAHMAHVAPTLKLKGRTRKYLFKQSMRGVLEDEIIDRKKGGFGAPIRTWIKQDLREMIGDLLSPVRIKRRGIFDPSAVAKLIERNARGEQDYSYLIYFLLSFEIWCQRFLDEVPQPMAAAA